MRIALAILFLSFATSCTTEQLSALAGNHPALAPTTQTVERVEVAVDKGAAKVQSGGEIVKNVGNAGMALGIPYSGWLTALGGIATALGTLWIKARNDNNNAISGGVTLANAIHSDGQPGVSSAVAQAISSLSQISPALKSAIKQTLPTQTTKSV